MQVIDCTELLSKIRTIQDRIEFFRELGPSYFLFLGLYYPPIKGFDGHFFLQVLKSEKKVNFFFFLTFLFYFIN